MYSQINKDQIFPSIMSNKDVFIIKPEEEKCVWVNPLTINDVVSLIDGEVVILVKENVKIVSMGRVNKFLDVVKFTDKMHKENIRQNELARLSGITPYSISKYIHHRNKPRKDTLDRICKVLKCNPEDILED